MQYDIETKICSKNGWDTPEQALKRYGRYSREGITIHWWGGGEGADKHDAIVNYFQDKAHAGIKSVNYVLSDNKITCMVEPDQVAWCSTKGNPTTISIECQPTLGDEGYKRLGWLIRTLEAKYGRRMTLYPHKFWNATDCPGTISLDRARQEADGVSDPGRLPEPHSPVPAPPKTAAQVLLPNTVDQWRLYDIDKAPNRGNEKAFLRPSKFPSPGLLYDIVEFRDNGNTAVIDTRDFGRGKVWISNTEAQLLSADAPKQAPKPTGNTVTLPNTVASWRAYPLDVLPRVGNERGQFLRPSKFPHDLVYDILDRPYPNVVTIKTDSYGLANIYVGPDTEARFN